MLKRCILWLLLGLWSIASSYAEEPSKRAGDRHDRAAMEGAAVETYKTVGSVQLNAYLFYSQDHQSDESRPAIVFFFGGGWRGGSPEQFRPHCLHLASRGMVAIAVEYRVRSRHGTLATACVEDAKSAIRWTRQHARRLGINPDAIVAGGGSAGGHIAACTAVLDGFEAPHEDMTVSSKPNGLALFNPALVLASAPGVIELTNEREAELRERMGVPTQELSPYHQLHEKLPPTIIFHGKADKTVHYDTADAFASAARKLGTPVVLHGYDNAGHGFFNYGRDDGRHFRQTLLQLDRFLVDHGLLVGPSPQKISTSLTEE